MDPVHYSISEKNQLDFSVMHFWASMPRFLAIMGGLVVVIVAVSWSLDDWGIALSAIVSGVVGVSIMLAIVRFFTIPRFARKAWRDFALIKEPVELALSEDGFKMTQPSAHVDAAWDNMLAWNETDSVFAIYVTQQQAYILPKAQVGTRAIDYVRERLIDSGLVKRGAKRKRAPQA